MKKYCLNCKKEFIPTSSNQRYCSKKCRDEILHYRNRKYSKKYREEHTEETKRYRQTLVGKYYINRALAKIKNHKWDLTLKDFETFWQKPCSYCGGKIKTIGLDRIDSTKGYTIDNVVSCCIICNRAKSNLSQKDFVAYLKRVVEFNK